MVMYFTFSSRTWWLKPTNFVFLHDKKPLAGRTEWCVAYSTDSRMESL